MIQIVCDRCKKPIEGWGAVRPVFCTRPLKYPPHRHDDYYDDYDDRKDRKDKDNHFPSDIVWRYDLCLDCSKEVEEYAKTKSD